MATPEHTSFKLTENAVIALLGANKQAREQAEANLLELRTEMLDLIARGKAVSNVSRMVEAAGIDRSYYYELVKDPTKGTRRKS